MGPNPWDVAVNPSMDRIDVADSGSGTVSIIDGSADAVVESVPVGNTPMGIAVNPVTNPVFVANGGDNALSVIEDLPFAPPPPAGPAPTGPREQLPRQGGVCMPVAVSYPDATPIGAIAGAVTPSGVLERLWQFDGVTWLAYSPQAPAASNLTQMDRLDVVLVCISGSGPGAGLFTRPVI